MSKTAILYIDLLGVQKMWVHGGAEAVRDRIAEFKSFVVNQLAYLPDDLHRDGDYTAILSGDSVSVMCEDHDQAIGIGSHLFTQAFYQGKDYGSPFWLRGSISSWSNQYFIANTEPIRAKGLQIGTAYVMEDQFLTALALEKSGFRGMRLILDSSVLPNHGHDLVRTWSGFNRPLGIVARLKHCSYPDGPQYSDVLWMADREDRYTHLRNIMASRFKLSTADPDEFVQASWTRAVFDQVDTLLWSCKQQ